MIKKHEKIVILVFSLLFVLALCATVWMNFRTATQSKISLSAIPTVEVQQFLYDGLININTAPAEILDELPGIGQALSQRIIDYRTKHGPFRKIDDIMKVKGIGEKTFRSLKPHITTGGTHEDTRSR